MRKIIFLILFLTLLPAKSFCQFTTDEITYVDRIDLENSNSWAVGAGFSNFIMHGDLRSLGTNSLGNFYNFGGYAYLNKMFNPLLGVEGKIVYTQISGGSQYLSNIYQILYLPNSVERNGVNETVQRENLLFRGRAYGAELNLILSFTNLYQANASKWHAAGYFGVGYHQYNSSLREKLDDGSEYIFPGANFGSNPTRTRQNEATSIYLSGQFSLKRRISKRVDLEVRTGMYFNYEDHLDATISSKQDWETFFVSSLGVAVKLGKKKIFTIWGDENGEQVDQFKVVDTDGDGVMDQLDKEPDTPRGVMVYGNGRAVDSDKDGIPDYQDKCPLKYGPIQNQGCPIYKDTDGDGIEDAQDSCPAVKGPESNRGCPIEHKEVTQQISVLAANIYFDSSSGNIRLTSYKTLDEIVELMMKVSDSKFTIEGHTDNLGASKNNLLLSQKRAQTVQNYLISKGIKEDRLQTTGYGETRPRYSNENSGGRQLNRRVEINPVNSFD